MSAAAIRVGLICTAALAWAASPFAHHGFQTEFDRAQSVTIRGLVTRLDWVSPHTWIYVDARDANGRAEDWRVQGAGPGVLTLAGWTKTTLAIGARVTIDGFRAKNGSRTMHGAEITIAGGRSLCVNVPCGCCPTIASAPAR